jgi:hypothetical protein
MNKQTTEPMTNPKKWFDKYKPHLIGVVLLIIIGIAIILFLKYNPSTSTPVDRSGGLTDSTPTPVTNPVPNPVPTPAPEPVNGKWGEWGTCYETSEIGTNGKKRWKRSRTCIQEAKNGGTPCNQLDGGNADEYCTPSNGLWKDPPPDSNDVCYKKTIIESGKPVERWFKKRECVGVLNGGNDCVGSDEVLCTPINGQWPTLGFEDPNVVCVLEKDKDGKPVLDPQGRQIFSKTITCTLPLFGGVKCPDRGEVGVTYTDMDGQHITAKKRCPPQEGFWSEWGAYCKGAACGSSTSSGSFIAGNYYVDRGVEKQLRYCIREGNQNCPLGDTVRNAFTEYSSCLPEIPPQGGEEVWVKKRTRLSTNQVDSVLCNPIPGWKPLKNVSLPDKFLLKNVKYNKYLTHNKNTNIVIATTKDGSTVWTAKNKNGVQESIIRNTDTSIQNEIRCVNIIDSCKGRSMTSSVPVASCDANDWSNFKQFSYDPTTKQLKVTDTRCNVSEVCLEMRANDNLPLVNYCDANRVEQRWIFEKA